MFSCEPLFRNLVLGSRIRPPARTPNLINIIRCDFCHPNAAKYDHNYSRRQTVVNSGPVSAFLRIMTSHSDTFGKRGTTGNVAGSVVPEFSRRHPGIMERGSPTEASLGSLLWIQDVLHPRRINPENIFFVRTRSSRKKSGATGSQRPGKSFAGDFLPVTFWS